MVPTTRSASASLLSGDGAWRAKLITAQEDIRRVVRSARRVAVVGIKPESKSDQPAHYVPSYLASVGLEVVPVPTYYPDVTEILNQKVVRSVSAIDGEVDIVNLFRKASDVSGHVDDILSMNPLPKCVWMQSGISKHEAAEQFAKAGIQVVQDRCLLVDYQNLS
ncbi:CoA-binding protein [Pycnococcus provasolii]